MYVFLQSKIGSERTGDDASTCLKERESFRPTGHRESGTLFSDLIKSTVI